VRSSNPARKNVAITIILTIPIPGLGHIYCGYRKRGALILLTMISISILRILLGGFLSPESDFAARALGLGFNGWAIYDAYRCVKRVNLAAERQAEAAHPLRLVTGHSFGENRKPFGVTVIAIVSIITGVGALVVGTLAPAGMDAMLDNIPLEWSSWYRLLLASTGVASCVIGYGLLKGFRWAWTWGITGLIAGMIWGVLAAFLNSEEALASGLGIVLSMIVIYYFFRPNVREYFRRSRAFAHSSETAITG
jgi:hypothetical protein